MAKLNFKASLPINGGAVETGLSLLSFKEDKVFIIYSPELDIAGTGYNSIQAKASFWEAVSEFFRYTTSKGTLAQELRRLGWTVSGTKKKPRVGALPNFNQMLELNDEFKDILYNKDYSKSTEMVPIPA
jgi:hypothetical protein